MSPPKKTLIAIAGLGCETSTFSPSRTHAPAFHPQRDSEILETYASILRPGTHLGEAAEWRGALIGHALPGGVVTREAFEALTAEMLARLGRMQGLQGLWFDIHGAMCVEGLEDSEAELLRRIRTVIGSEVVVSASMDLHGNVSRALLHQCDLLAVYRTAPHVDVLETKARACANLVAVLALRAGGGASAGGRRGLPLKAWVPVPILLPGEQTSTRMEPAKSLYAAVPEVEAMAGVLDAGVWVGYAWADEPRDRAAVVVTGWDRAAVTRGAERLARMFWASRAEFEFVAPHGSLDECVDAALASRARPYFVSDSGDNPTAGGAGDVTWSLQRLLERPEFGEHSGSSRRVIYASIPAGPVAVGIAVAAGVGGTVTVTAGAEVDDTHAGPLELTGRVHAIKHGDPHARTEVVLQVGSIYIILTELRKPYHHEHDFTDLNLDPRHARDDIVVVKIGYLEPELFDMAKGWMLALTPGGVDQDLLRLGHKRIRRPMWPFEREREEEPDLRARMIAASCEPLTGVDE
ncbi:hypothetical protein LTR08_005329 [Meristemomyces frigidus]|nr:hypothetical protein LTR08_005329 [Meristemomyces frigidus]